MGRDALRHSHPVRASRPPEPLCVLVCLLLAGCAPAATNGPMESTAPPATVTALVPTVTATQTPTRTPTLTATPVPSPTATPLPQPINAATAGRLAVTEGFTLHTRGSVERLLWTPDGAWILAQIDDRLDVIGPELLEIEQSYDGFDARHFIQDGRLFGTRDQLPVLLDLAAGKIEPVGVDIPAEGAGRTGFDLSQDGKFFAIPVDRFGFDVIDIATGEARRYEFLMNNLDWFSVPKVSFSYDGTLVVVNAVRRDKIDTVVGIELKWGNKMYEFVAYGELVFSADGQRMMAQTPDGLVGTYIVANGEPWSDLSWWYSNEAVDGGRVFFSGSSAQFWGGDEPQGYKIGILYEGTYSNYETDLWYRADSQLLIYDTRSDDLIQSLVSLPPLIRAFTFSPDGATFVLATPDGDLTLWETASGVPKRNVTAYDVDTEPQISPDGQRVAYSYHDSARVYSPSGELLQVITPSLSTLDLEVRFVDADRLALFYASLSGEYVEFWDLASGMITYVAPYVARPCEFTPDGHTMVCRERTTRFLDTRTGEWLMDVVDPKYATGRYAASPDDRYLAYCSEGSPSIFLYKRKGGAYQGMFTDPHGAGVCGGLSFSPDGTRLASAAGFVWDVSTRRVALTFEGADQDYAVRMPLAYGPQGDIFFVGGEVFDAATGSQLAQLPVGGQTLYFSSDGTRLTYVSGGECSVWTTH